MSDPRPLSWYEQWRNRDANFRVKSSSSNQFANWFKQGSVERFEVTQDANQAGIFTRCFFKLFENDKLYQCVPLCQPFTFTAIGLTGRWIATHPGVWQKDFNMTKSGKFQLIFERHAKSSPTEEVTVAKE